eukprot:703315-Pelagomonas_calceolata.AAC.5
MEIKQKAKQDPAVHVFGKLAGAKQAAEQSKAQTSGGSVANDADKVAKPVLYDTEVLSAHQPFITYSLPLGNQQHTKQQKLAHPHTWAGVQVLLLIASANFRAFTSLSTEQLAP